MKQIKKLFYVFLFLGFTAFLFKNTMVIHAQTEEPVVFEEPTEAVEESEEKTEDLVIEEPQEQENTDIVSKTEEIQSPETREEIIDDTEFHEQDTCEAGTPNVTYASHVQTYGWQGWKKNGQKSGTSGKSKRLEGIKIKITNKGNLKGDILYRTHIQTYGWQSWKKNGQLSGTTGKAKRLEALQVKLTGDMAKRYDVYYRVHAQNIGWMGWAKNGQKSGTEGLSYRLEAVEIKLVRKGNGSSTTEQTSFVKNPVRGNKFYMYDSNSSNYFTLPSGVKFNKVVRLKNGDFEFRFKITNKQRNGLNRIGFSVSKSRGTYRTKTAEKNWRYDNNAPGFMNFIDMAGSQRKYKMNYGKWNANGGYEMVMFTDLNKKARYTVSFSGEKYSGLSRSKSAFLVDFLKPVKNKYRFN